MRDSNGVLGAARFFSGIKQRVCSIKANWNSASAKGCPCTKPKQGAGVRAVGGIDVNRTHWVQGLHGRQGCCNKSGGRQSRVACTGRLCDRRGCAGCVKRASDGQRLAGPDVYAYRCASAVCLEDCINGVQVGVDLGAPRICRRAGFWLDQ